jgi:predicted phage terminase large subunit-like protein
VPFDEPLEYRWESGAKIKMAHLEHESNVHDWQGAQVPLFLFDELTHFTSHMFWYMLSRNRSTCGVRPYIRASCNPDADSWVAELIAWWINQETGFAIPERAGVLRYFARIGDQIIWGDAREDVMRLCPGVADVDVKSLTFIPGRLDENKILLQVDPGYRGNLMAMTRVERARLLDGNWKVRKSAGSYFRRSDVRILDVAPTNLAVITRRWDLAASEPTEAYANPDYTCGVKLGRYPNGRFVVLHAELQRIRANDVRELIKRMAAADGKRCSIGVPQDPAQAGKDQAESYVRDLAGFVVYAEKESGSKEVRAEPCAAQWQHQNIDVVKGEWNDAFFSQLEAFPDPKVHDDAVDALSGAFHRLVSKGATMADIL